jgi:LPXTG-site transpeptidase (sortase) family protein
MTESLVKNWKVQFYIRAGLVFILVVFIVFSALAIPYSASAASTAEYYIPGSTDELFQILQDIDNDPELGNAFGLGSCTASPCNRMHNVITVIVDQDNAQVFYDHWENGYTAGASGDETYIVKKGNVLTFESFNILVPRSARNTCNSTNPSGASTSCYDGRDRLYAIGGVFVVEAFWPEVTATVFANAWEIYPVYALENSYTVPVGENLALPPTSYLDFDQAFVIVQALQNGTNVQVDDPAVAGVEVNTTLNRGETARLFHTNAGTTVTATAPVQVQFIVGQIDPGLSSESRSYSAVPSNLWESSYYSPVSGFSGGYDTDVFIYNPTGSNLVVNYEDRVGAGSFTVPANSTRSYQALTGRFVPPNSALFLEAVDPSISFWAIGAVDTENAAYNYGFSLIPPALLAEDYYLGWAPGTTDLSANGSPVFVTPTADNTTVYVDYHPLDGVVDVTFTLNRIQMQKIFDPDRNNTGMHIWSTNPIALVWGEDPNTAAIGNPYIDAGYTILPTQLLITTPTPTVTPTSPSQPRNTPTPGVCTNPANCPADFFIPITGFSPNETTYLNPVAHPVYIDTNISLEIPVLKISAPIVGVQQKEGRWDVSWLWDQAGWLQGSAYPTFPGNSVLTAHVVTADGKPGPFQQLRHLKAGEYVFIYGSGYRYTYKVESNQQVLPNDASVFRHEEKSWLTLVTCDDYDEATGMYLRRVVVRTVLVDVREIK